MPVMAAKTVPTHTDVAEEWRDRRYERQAATDKVHRSLQIGVGCCAGAG
jgi:hypothetical protein